MQEIRIVITIQVPDGASVSTGSGETNQTKMIIPKPCEVEVDGISNEMINEIILDCYGEDWGIVAAWQIAEKMGYTTKKDDGNPIIDHIKMLRRKLTYEDRLDSKYDEKDGYWYWRIPAANLRDEIERRLADGGVQDDGSIGSDTDTAQADSPVEPRTTPDMDSDTD